ncbi:hypothetical protein AB0M45_06440 [Nocardia sp. NPDC051787]|uniref:hypothetical protein n=1 Tax=Nocardia sp. NPDC051787 TaxID=3155415 RepID=UPI00343C9C8D
MSIGNSNTGDVKCPPDARFRPLVYGYLRLDLLSGSELSQCHAQLETFAREHGYEFAAVFHESPPQSWSVPQAFAELVHACRRSGAHMVVTLAGHLSGMAMSRICLLDFLAARGNAHLMELPA